MAAGAAGAAGAVRAQVVVLEARGPSAGQFAKGRVLPLNVRLDLKAGDVLRVIDPSGVRTLTGPLGASPAVPRDGRLAQVFNIPAGVFIGEVAFLHGTPASATATLGDGARFISWPVRDLTRALQARTALRNTFIQLIGLDAAETVGRA